MKTDRWKSVTIILLAIANIILMAQLDRAKKATALSIRAVNLSLAEAEKSNAIASDAAKVAEDSQKLAIEAQMIAARYKKMFDELSEKGNL